MPLAPVYNSMPISALVQQASSNAETETAAAQKAIATKTDTTKTNFFEQFKFSSRNQSESKPSYEQLQERAENIRRAGAFLQKHPMPEMVKTYINDVRDLLSDLSDQAYAGDHQDGLFQKLNVIDEKLDALADKVLSDEKNGLELADSLGELDGLLIDIFV